MTTKTTIVIIGASCAGISTAHSILKELPTVKLILINPFSKFYFNISAPRILAKPSPFKPE
jgi:NADH dehydrogenase FAD-containing subunit